MRTTTARKPAWLLPRYTVARPVIAAVGLLAGLAVAAGADCLLHAGPMVVALASMLVCSGAGAALHELRAHLLNRIQGSPHDQLMQALRDIEAQAIDRFCTETTCEMDAVLIAVMPADPATPDHYSARGGAA